MLFVFDRDCRAPPGIQFLGVEPVINFAATELETVGFVEFRKPLIQRFPVAPFAASFVTG